LSGRRQPIGRNGLKVTTTGPNTDLNGAFIFVLRHSPPVYAGDMFDQQDG
jgi:hypothetical protein